MTSPLFTLALDAGQTGIRTLLISDSNRVEGAYPGLLTDRELFGQLATVIADALTAAGVSADDHVTLCVGMTGLTAANSLPADLLAKVPASVKRVLLVHDSISGFLGAIGLGEGVMTAVGTGVVTLGVGANDIARVDGWGNLVGDAGSAYWIGRAGLDAGMRAYDGRLDSPALLSLVTDNFSHPEEAYIDLQTSTDRVARIAGFARDVIEMAATDTHAADIVRSAGRELAISAHAAARRVGLDTALHPKFSWAGNVMKSDLLRESFAMELVARIPHAVLVPPVGEPIDGVALLELVPDESPLRPVIHESTRS